MSSGFRQENVKDWEVGEWTVHPSSHELVHRSGRRVRLEARAMRVLQVLRANQGEVVTTDALLDQVWDRKVVSPHSVTTVISELRKVLGEDASLSRVIETIPKRGYRLASPCAAGEASQPSQPSYRSRLRLPLLATGIGAVLLLVGVLWISGVDSFGTSGPRAIESTRAA